MNPLVIPPLNKRRYYYLGASILLVVLGIVRLVESGDLNDGILGSKLVGGLMILAGLMWSALTIQTLLRRSYAVMMDDDGITIRVPQVGSIEWNEIAAVRTDMVRGRGYVHIILRDPEAVLAREPSLERHIAEAEVWFDASEIDMSPRELSETIIQRRNALRR